MMEWISVNRQPETLIGIKRVLAYSKTYGTFVASFVKRKDRYENDNGMKVNNVTHWMPLPEPPKEETK